jgi:hypothetical protein
VAEEHDGWVDHDEVPTVQPAPRGLELPDGPRRVKRPGDQDQ